MDLTLGGDFRSLGEVPLPQKRCLDKILSAVTSAKRLWSNSQCHLWCRYRRKSLLGGLPASNKSGIQQRYKNFAGYKSNFELRPELLYDHVQHFPLPLSVVTLCTGDSRRCHLRLLSIRSAVVCWTRTQLAGVHSRSVERTSGTICHRHQDSLILTPLFDEHNTQACLLKRQLSSQTV